MRKSSLCLLSLVLALVAPAAPPEVAPQSAPKLILTLVVDQFRYDYLTRFRSDYNGGLARLLTHGAVFSNAHYEHFPTVTAIGHSTILSGATPSISGIVGNEWYDRELNKQVTSVSDSTVQLLGGRAGETGASPRKLLVSTIGDELKMSGKGTPRVIGISIKDRSAILPAGHMADAAYWFDDATGNFVSSTYYFDDLPVWVKAFNSGRAVDRYITKQWSSNSGTAGAAPQVFATMPPKPDSAYFKLLERTPFGNEVLELFAEHAIEAEQLGQRGTTDLLSVSFSSNDYVGHGLGPDAPEVRDISIQTDRLFARLLDFVDHKVGLDNVLVIFTADHGVSPLPELMKQRKMPGGRMSARVVLDGVQKAIAAKYGEGNWVIGKSGPAPYFNYQLIRERKLDLAEVQRVAADVVRSIPHIARVYTREQLKNGQILEDRIGRRVRNGFNNERGSDLFIVVEPYWLFEERGTSHGTPYNYDSHVPVIFMGRGIKAGQYNQPIAVNDIAPTLATFLAIETPSGAEGRVLDEMLTAPAPGVHLSSYVER
ncbi:MAG: alkaline phosphatase family protein [Bryobacterales bacterium]|nr:alkaline phosphatase family protein [Bryobacterales bacterium]